VDGQQRFSAEHEHTYIKCAKNGKLVGIRFSVTIIKLVSPRDDDEHKRAKRTTQPSVTQERREETKQLLALIQHPLELWSITSIRDRERS
jgi:hypothetical protein